MNQKKQIAVGLLRRVQHRKDGRTAGVGTSRPSLLHPLPYLAQDSARMSRTGTRELCRTSIATLPNITFFNPV